MYNTGLEMRSILVRKIPGLSPDGYLDSINEAYAGIAKIRSWSFLEKNFNLVTKAYVGAGGAHFTKAGTTVSASTCASWSGGESDGYAGMFIKKSEGASYYTITASTTSLVTITEDYGGITTTAEATAGDGYAIFKHMYSVDSSIETVTHLMHNTYLMDWDEKEIEIRDPDFQVSGEPHRWRACGNDSNGCTLVEIYPRLIDGVYELRGKGQVRTEVITDLTKPLLDSHLILSLAEVDLLRRKRIMTPEAITDDMLDRAYGNFQDKLDIAVRNDLRKNKGGRYTPDRLFGVGHRGQRWLINHDPWDA